MFTYEDILNLGCNETIILNDLAVLAKEAKEAELLIAKTYLFPVFKKCIVVWSDDYNAEYITHSGMWQARYLHQSYNVLCKADVIFDYMKADYLIKNKYASETENGIQTDEGYKAEVYRYFSVFLKKTKDLSKKG